MKYDAQGVAELYLSATTDLQLDQFETKFHEENIIKATLQLVLSDGSTQNINVIDFLKLQWCSIQEKENH